MFIALSAVGRILNVGAVLGASTTAVARTTFEAVFPNSSVQSLEIRTQTDLLIEIAVQTQEGKKEVSTVVNRLTVPVSQQMLPYLNSAEFLAALSPDDRKLLDKRMKFFTKFLRKKEAIALANATSAQNVGVGGGIPGAVEPVGGQVVAMNPVPTAELSVKPEDEAKQIERVAKVRKLVGETVVAADIPFAEVSTMFPNANLSAVDAALNALAKQMSGVPAK